MIILICFLINLSDKEVSLIFILLIVPANNSTNSLSNSRYIEYFLNSISSIISLYLSISVVIKLSLSFNDNKLFSGVLKPEYIFSGI